jgi:hypothetical protein
MRLNSFNLFAHDTGGNFLRADNSGRLFFFRERGLNSATLCQYDEAQSRLSKRFTKDAASQALPKLPQILAGHTVPWDLTIAGLCAI